MTFARRVFLIAGIYGLLALGPIYFMEERIGQEQPPPINHPEFFYAFAGVAISWQVAFLIIARDPGRYRPLMIPSILEKATVGFAMVALFAVGRIVIPVLAVGLIDMTWGLLFTAAYWATRPRSNGLGNAGSIS